MTRPARSEVSAPNPAFRALCSSWMQDQATILLKFAWIAYDSLCSDKPFVDGRDLERSITQLLEPRINRAMSGDEPFYIQHGSYEHETMAAPPAQPPAYDLAFVLRSEERIMWPIEAKVLETPGATADYERDIRDQFLTCRYSPFSGAGAMIGYLLKGIAHDAFTAIEKGLGAQLSSVPGFDTRPHRVSSHTRNVPVGKLYPKEFECHHLVMEFAGLKRTKGKPPEV